jgi:transcriptional regulator with XRE-family HTH domain
LATCLKNSQGVECQQSQSITIFKTVIADIMKRDETPLLPPPRLIEAHGLGERITQLRQGLRLRQSDVAARAGLSRSTAILIEKGDPGRTLTQILRYVHAMAPDVSLQALLAGDIPALIALHARKLPQRVRSATKAELRDLDF